MVVKLAYTPEEAAELLSISRTALFALLKSDEIKSFTVGRSRRITHEALESFIAARGMVSHAIKG